MSNIALSRLSVFKLENKRESAMAKKIAQFMVVLAILVASFASSGGASAWSGCASYITVQWGDTLSRIAARSGTTIEAIQAVNPGLGWWVYAGQVLCIPTGYASAPVYYPTLRRHLRGAMGRYARENCGANRS